MCPLTLLRPAAAAVCWLDATIELNPIRTVEVAEAVLVLVALRSIAVDPSRGQSEAEAPELWRNGESATPRTPLNHCIRRKLEGQDVAPTP